MQALTLKFCLFVVIVTLYHVVHCNIDIVRGERDRFTNLGGCYGSNAVCFNESCVDCHCMVNQTFIQRRGQYGKCVSNELIVYATSYEASFLVQNNISMSCIYQQFIEHTTFVLESSLLYVCNEKNQGSRWIWTNFGQLLNWKTMECMTDDYYSDSQYYITMKKCERSNQKQLWECVGEKNYDIIQTRSHRYMYYGAFQYVTTRYTQPSDNTKWQRFGSERDVCSQAVGCEIFADGSSLLILDTTKCEKQSECFGEKEIRLSKTKCFLLPNKIQYLRTDTWKVLEKHSGRFFVSSSSQKVFLKWNLTKTAKSWGGIMVKVQFMCENTAATKTEHCVVIKYTGAFTGFNYNIVDGDIPRNPSEGGENRKDGGENGKGGGENEKNGGENGKDDYENDLNNAQESSSADKDSTKIIIIVVCVLVLFCAAGMIGTIVYKRRNRSAPSKNTENPETDENSPPMVEELPESTNPQNNDSQPTPNQSQLHAKPKSQHEYQYVDTNDRTFALQPRSSNYEIPQSPTYEYPEIRSQSHQYDYPSFGKPILKKAIQQGANTTGIYTDAIATKTDSGYTPLTRRPVNNDDDNGYTHLKDVQRKKEKEGATEEKDSSNAYLTNSKKASEEGNAKEGKNEEDELSYVVPMDSQYTALVRPPLKNGESEDPSYEPLIKNRK